MNYTLIIILVILLFVIYQLDNQEKIEGFKRRRTRKTTKITGTQPSCPSDYKIENYNTKCYNIANPDMKINPTCPTGKTLIQNINSAGVLDNYSYCCPESKKKLVKGTGKNSNKWFCKK